MNTSGNIIVLLIVLLMLIICLFLAVLLLRMHTALSAMQSELSENKDALEQLSQTQSQNSRQISEDINGHLSRVYSQLGAENSTLFGLQNSMKDINTVMSNAKQRGSWGEYQMESLIRVYAGESPSVYETQFRLDNGKIADGAFHLPSSEKVLCIDSKFPMENYLNMLREPEDEAYYSRELRKNIKKHIEDVASKYITPQTADEAVLFIPSEAIYQYILAEQQDLFELALSKHVLLCSPTTLSGVVFTLVFGLKDYYRSENAGRIEKELLQLKDEFIRLEDKASKANRNAALVCDQLGDVFESTKRMIRLLSRLDHPEDFL